MESGSSEAILHGRQELLWSVTRVRKATTESSSSNNVFKSAKLVIMWLSNLCIQYRYKLRCMHVQSVPTYYLLNRLMNDGNRRSGVTVSCGDTSVKKFHQSNPR